MTDDGSTVSTATRLPLFINSSPNASINEDLPTPGLPDIPAKIND